MSIEEFEKECRDLWIKVATAYATDGQYPERMKLWADRAVKDYRETFEYDIKVKLLEKELV